MQSQYTSLIAGVAIIAGPLKSQSLKTGAQSTTTTTTTTRKINSILYFHNNTSKIHKSKYNKTFSTAKRQESYGGDGWKAKKA